MDRDDKHALFAAAALQVLLADNLRKPEDERQTLTNLVVDAAWFADGLIFEVEKK